MHFLLIDESNVTEEQGDFFVVAGLIVNTEQIPKIIQGIKKIRETYGFRNSDSFKFETRSRPKHVSQDDFKRAKSDLIQLLIDEEAVLLVYVILHAIAVNENLKYNYAYNVLLHQFESKYLSELNDVGAVIVDRRPNEAAVNSLKDIFMNGIDVPSGGKRHPESIMFYSISADMTSHLSSAIDVALGAFRLCVNSVGGRGSELVAQEILPQVSKLVWSKFDGTTNQVHDYGYLPRPKSVDHQPYEAKYKQLGLKLTEWSSTD